MTRRLRIDDLTDLAVPSAPALSPDGSAVAYVVRTLDAPADRACDRIWLVSTDGSGSRPLTAGPVDAVPVWSPDGSRLAFLREGQIALLDLGGADPEVLTELPLGAGAPAWSPDGTRLAFAAPAGPSRDATAPLVTDGVDYQADGAGMRGLVPEQVHVLDVRSRTVRVLTDGPLGAGAPRWSPDGERLVFTRRTGTDTELEPRIAAFVLAVEGKDTRPEAVAFGTGMAFTADFTADGESLLVVGYPGTPVGHAHLLLVPLDGSEPVDLGAGLDRNIMPGATAYPGGRPTELDGRILFCLRERGCTHLWSVAPDGSDARAVLEGSGQVVSGLTVAGGRVAVVLGTPTSFGEIVLLDPAGGSRAVLTAHGEAPHGAELFVGQEREFTISDGTRVHGRLYHDGRPGPVPLLLDIHGGPHNAWSGAADEMHPYQQELVSRGWAVLTVNPRGSDGYGESFFDGVQAAWGLADANDFLEPVAELVAEGLADPDRLAVTGYSYGGFMTCWLTAHDGRFAAAITGGVVSDLTSMGGTSDDAHLLSVTELGATPWQEPERFREMSPISKVAEVRTPTLILHGAADRRCPVGQAQQWHTALRELGVPTRMVLYPEASHAFVLIGRPSHRIDYSRRLVDWLDEYVTRRPRIDARHWEESLHALAERHQVVGAQLGILRLGTEDQEDEVVEVVHGVLNRRTGLPVTPDSLFQIGSISKVWTATLVLQLVAEGLLDLDAPVRQILPDLKLADDELTNGVTVRQLLTHTSGIDGDVFTDTGRGDDCLVKYAGALAEAGRNHPPGATWSYCNSGYSLLGLVVETLTDRTWDQALREKLLTPLGLTSTVTLPEEALLFSAAVGHDDGEPVGVWGLPRSLGPAGLITSTAREVLAFARMHLNGGLAADGNRVLGEKETAAMAAHEVDLPDPYLLGDSWGLGWIRSGWDGHRLIGHDGNTLGQSAYLRILPEQGLAVALLTNGGHTGDLYQDLYREIFAELAGVTMNAPITPPEEPVEVDIAPYVGTYERASAKIEIEDASGGPLMRTTATGPIAELLPDPVEEHRLTPVGPGLFVLRPPGSDTWIPVTFYQPDGEHWYLHFGARATPRTSAGVV